jgi:hypothetical protein
MHQAIRPSRLAFAAAASIAALGLGAGAASAQDNALTAPTGFTLTPTTLEPGCWLVGAPGNPMNGFMNTTPAAGGQAHVDVLFGAPYSVDQVLVPSTVATAPGYKVYNTFDTGTNNADPDIDPVQGATDLYGPGGNAADPAKIIVCVSGHDDEQNEPYVQDGLPGEVAATNRPIIQPTIAALGVSAVGPLHTYKLGFGYSVQRGYDSKWRTYFGSGGDPMASGGFTSVDIVNRIRQAGVRRWNDIDQFSETFSGGVSNYGQPHLFDVSGSGDPQAYLHNSFGLLTFTTQGDLPITWAVKPSLAPESYGKAVTYTDDMLRAWNASWQAYYAGKGPKPALPLAPGTNSPDIDPSVGTPVNLQERRDANGTTTVVNNVIVTPPAPKPTKVMSARLMGKGKHRYVRVMVSSPRPSAHLRIRLYNARGA